jgi:protein TonB
MQLSDNKIYSLGNIGRIFSIMLLFTHFEVFAQKTITVRKEIKGRLKYQSYSEKYHVLKDDRSIMHGLYEVFDSKNRLITSGYYREGKKDSIWTEYNIWEHFVAAEGRYSEGKKAGIWTFFKDADTVELKYDFDSDSVLYFKANISKKYSIITGADTIKTTLDRPPLYLGGSGYISKVISDNIFYPDEAREKNVEGRVLVAFTIYPDGHASAPWVLKSIRSSIDTEAISVASHIPSNWSPGIQYGKAVTSIYVLPIVFKLE